MHIYFVQHFIVSVLKIKFKIGMRTKVAVSSVIDGGRKLVEVEVEVEGIFYWWKKPEYPEKTIDLKPVTDKLYHSVVSSTSRLRGV